MSLGNMFRGWLKVGTGNAPVNKTAGDLTAKRVFVGSADAAIPASVTIETDADIDTQTGYRIAGTAASGALLQGNGTKFVSATDIKIPGYLRVGSASAPTNTTAGDLTSVRHFLNDQTYPVGVFQSVAYASGDYTVFSGAATWTVDSGDKTTFEWVKVGSLVFVMIVLDATTLNNNLANVLRIALPAALVPATTSYNICDVFDGAGAGTAPAVCWASAGTAAIFVQRSDGSNFTGATNGVYVRLFLPIHI